MKFTLIGVLASMFAFSCEATEEANISSELLNSIECLMQIRLLMKQ